MNLEARSYDISSTEIRHTWYENDMFGVDMEEDAVPEQVENFLLYYKATEYNRLRDEYLNCMEDKKRKTEGHPFGNPLEPVAHALILKQGKVLLITRGGTRGYGQLALPGGYVENTESTFDCACRETFEETKLDLLYLGQTGEASCVLRELEENLDDLGSRTLGINYLFMLKPDLEVDLSFKSDEVLEVQWVSLSDILTDKVPLFFNHSLVIKRLLSKLDALVPRKEKTDVNI